MEKEQKNTLEKKREELAKEIIDARKIEFDEFQTKLFDLQQEYGFSIEAQYTIRHDGIKSSYYLVDQKNILNNLM